MPLHFYFSFLSVGRHLSRLYAEVLLTHCWNELGGNASHPSSTTPNRYFGQRNGRAVLPVESVEENVGDWMYASNPLVPILLSPFEGVVSIPLRTVHSRGNMITESFGVEKTCWGHLAPSGNLNKNSSINSPEGGCLLTTSLSHIQLLYILSGLSALSSSETDH